MTGEEHWKWVKQEREKIVGWQCEFGGCLDPWSDGHHITYEREGREWPEDILLLCRYHHDVAHSTRVLGQLSFDDVVLDAVPDNVVNLEGKRLRRWYTPASDAELRIEGDPWDPILVQVAADLLWEVYSRGGRLSAEEQSHVTVALVSLQQVINLRSKGA